MQVILREDVAALGKAGEVVKVAEGFGRNYLLPQRKALVADPKNLKALERQKKIIAVRQAALRQAAEELAGRIAAAALRLEKQAGEGGKLFGTVTPAELSVELQKQGIAVDRKAIHLEVPVHEIGEFVAKLRLHADVTAELKFSVVAK